MGRIYTKRGDGGMTDLADGSRVRKDSVRIEAYGTVDELNSNLGLLMASLTDETAKKCIVGCQNVLFDIGAVLATADESMAASMQTVRQEDVEALEQSMDEWNATLPGWRGFVLPGGTEAASRAQVCRAVCRRAERRVLELAAEAPVPGEVLCYLNRLSDLLFVLAQRENFLCGCDEILWQKRR
ncbi:MAG: cob(I)yrinic acid a,c-diamide adenosyltransferase [Bacteroidaceae bacterium]|nr:cob(I)yrinic acid a,c-diamide adenosyltransferase [Bacteroidaceae bacterium]